MHRHKRKINTLKKRTKILFILAVVLAAAGLAAAGFFIGKTTGKSQADEKLKQLYALNRSSVEKLSTGGEPVYVIGHRSPDSDTVCSAITYARLLTMLGYKAEAAVTASVNKETAYILDKAGTEAPPVLEDAFPDYDEYDGTSFIYRTGMGRKSVFVPGLTEYLSAHPH